MSKRKERSIISIIGRTNAGKSTVLNLLSGQKNHAIVDSNPGTTTDTVTALMEIHDLGPFKILDTAGVDEYSVLGDKKRKKTYQAIEEADLSLIVIDLEKATLNHSIDLELKLINKIQKYNKQVLIIYNILNKNLSEKLIKKHKQYLDKQLGSQIPSISINAADTSKQRKLTFFIASHFKKESRHIDLLPNIKKQGYVLLIIPMDEETPTLRLLRPQDMAVERLLRNYAIPVLFRIDLKKARSLSLKLAENEKKRFSNLIKTISSSNEGLQLVITDSQAFDIVTKWTPKKFPFTSFSVMMTNYMSFGNLIFFIESMKVIDKLKTGDKILIAEACNHDRKCNDIATVQIPKRLESRIGGKLNFEFNFGRPFPENLNKFKLIIHCGGCMIDRQKYLRRMLKAKEAKVPYTNYGLLLAYLQKKSNLKRVIQPFL